MDSTSTALLTNISTNSDYLVVIGLVLVSLASIDFIRRIFGGKGGGRIRY